MFYLTFYFGGVVSGDQNLLEEEGRLQHDGSTVMFQTHHRQKVIGVNEDLLSP